MSPSWDDRYEEEERVWTGRPHPAVERIADLVDGGRVLDLGVGEGRDALFLASEGFEVTGVDVSEVAVDRFRERAEEEGLDIDAVVSDIRDFEAGEQYDIVLSINTLHFFKCEEFRDIVERMKEWTAPGGFNLVAVFVKDEDFPLDPECVMEEEELREMYSDWEIVTYNERKAKMKKQRPDGSHYRHNWGSLLVRKT